MVTGTSRISYNFLCYDWDCECHPYGSCLKSGDSDLTVKKYERCPLCCQKSTTGVVVSVSVLVQEAMTLPIAGTIMLKDTAPLAANNIDKNIGSL
jgi:hypothetical protein